jgi:hypothetical protein
MPSDASSPSRERPSGGPVSRIPTRLLCGLTWYGREVSVVNAAGVNQSSRGPDSTRRTISAGIGGTGATSTHGSWVQSSPTGSRVPAATGSGPTPDSRSVHRAPSTGATAMPPRTAR